MPNPVIHFEIGAKNGKSAIDFYGKLFDWKIEVDQKMNYGMVSQQGSGIGGGVYQTKDGVPPHVTFYVKVDDLQKYLDKAVKLGGIVTLPPTQISPEIGWCAMFTDPDGNSIGLFKVEMRES